MDPILHTRREFSLGMAAMLPALGVAKSALGADAEGDRLGVSRNNESIHQEIVFKATRKRVYEAITEEKQFRAVTNFIIQGASTQISADVGGSFAMFGGIIVGRHVELVPYERIVQAWREKDWPAGVYSIVKFQLDEQGAQTKLVFDHTGFPQGAAEHLAPGWWTHYWEPLQKYLA
jgi:activator of HSP90 ATPase